MASDLTVQTIRGPGSGANANKILIPSGQTLDASNGFIPPAGHIVQIINNTVSNNGNDTQAISAQNANVTIDSLTTSITPKFTGSKIYIIVNIMVGSSASGWSNQRLLRNGTQIVQTSRYDHSAYGGGIENVPFFNYLDPNTTTAGVAITYSVTYNNQNAYTTIINWNNNGVDKSSSYVTLMEIKQ